MISIKKILVPVDFSPRCCWAVSYASNLARRFDAEMVVIHIGEPSSLAKLEAFAGAGSAGVRRRELILEGDPAEEITEYEKANAVDLIVMPTHAHGRFRRFLLGSVTAKVLHDAICPVWTGVHHQDAPLSDKAEVKNVICAVDCDPSCVPLVRWATDLTASLGAELRIVHAVTAADETSDNRGEIELRHYLFHRAEMEFVRLFESAGMTARVTLAGGGIAKVVREAALREHADAVVIGRGHVQAGFGRLRTHAYAILRESPCPVVSI